MNTNTLLSMGLLVSFLAAGLTGSFVSYQNHLKAERQLQRLGQQAAHQLSAKLERIDLGLRGVQGLVMGAGHQFNQQLLADYLASNNILQSFPSLRGFCFVTFVEAAHMDATVRALRAENPRFELRQYAAHPGPHYLLTYIEPAEHLGPVHGVDLASEPLRRQTLEHAARSPRALLTPPLKGAGDQRQNAPDYLMVLSVSLPGQQHPYGWVASPLFIDDLWAQLEVTQRAHFRLQDGDVWFGAERPRNGEQPTESSIAAALPWRRLANFATNVTAMGRHWRLHASPNEQFYRELEPRSAALSALVTLLITGLCVLLVHALRKRRLEHAHRETSQREQLGTLIDAAPCGMMFIDEGYNFVAVNQQLCVLTGYGRPELIGQSFNLLMGQDEQGQNLLQQGASAAPSDTGSGVNFEMMTKRKTGNPFPASVGFSTLVLAGRRYIVATLEDITERKAIEHKIVESEILFRNLANAMPQHVWTARGDGTLTYINHRMGKYFGRPLAALQPNHWPDILHPDDLSRVTEDWQHSVAANEKYEVECRLRNHADEYRWHIVRAVPVASSDTAEAIWYGTNTDITEYKAAQLESLANAHNTQAILNSVVDALITIDEQGIISSVNDAAKTLFGYSKQEMLGQNVSMIMPEPYRQQHDSYLARYRATGDPHIIGGTRQLEGQHKDGSEFKIELRVVENYQAGQRYFLGIIRDITERFYNERLLAAQDRSLSLIARNTELPVTLEALTRDIEALAPGMYATVLLLDASGQRLLHGAAPSLPSEYNAAINGGAIGPKAGSCGSAAFLRKQVVVTDIETDPLWTDYRDLALAHGLRACWSTPIFAQNELLGTFAMYFKTRRAPTAQHRRIINMAIHVASLAISHERRETRIRQLAFYDSLTALPNRALGLDRLNRAIADAHRRDERLAIIFIDLDGFKNINDSLGHHVGDKLLQQAAARLHDCVRENDTVARLGGDEFFIILHGTSDKIADVVTRKILQAMCEKFQIDTQELHLSCSMGVSLFPNDGQDANTLLRNADAAMYSAKALGRNNVQYYTEDMNRSAVERITLEQEMRAGIDRDEFELYYQPRINNATNTIIGLEALVRWRHPSRGFLAPNIFIPVAEQSGLIVKLGDWVMQQACRQLSEWLAQDCTPIAMSVNLSPRQFHDKLLIEKVQAALTQAQLAPNLLELEITESMVMDEGPSIITILHELKLVGVTLAIDDFGTGYSNLSRLKHLPVDVIKIDKSFVDGIPDDLDDVAIATTIIAMAHHLKLKIVAEGVETYEQQQFLSDKHCDEMQGYLFGKPEPADKIGRLIGAKV